MEELTAVIEEATARVSEEYFRLKIDGGYPIYRELVYYSYELYHQMRCWWPTNTPFYLNGEVDKRAHPILKELEVDNMRPDLLVHRPGCMEYNHAIIEVKPSKVNKNGSIGKKTKCNTLKDLKTLSRFTSEAGYQRAIYLVYGCEATDFAAHVKEIADEFKELEPIELWLHAESGKPAACHTMLSAD